MKTIWDYPVKFVYGFSAAYGPTFHTGEDRPAPIGTSVTVNGVEVGKSGNTGLSTGPHCHIGKWSGGKSSNPAGGGASFKYAVVTEIHPTSTDNNGKYVRVTGDGYSWVYLHLSSISVKVGQVLKGGDMAQSTKVDLYTGRILAAGILGWDGTNGQVDALGGGADTQIKADFVGKYWYDVVSGMYNSADAKKAQAFRHGITGEVKPYSGPELFVKA